MEKVKTYSDSEVQWMRYIYDCICMKQSRIHSVKFIIHDDIKVVRDLFLYEIDPRV